MTNTDNIDHMKNKFTNMNKLPKEVVTVIKEDAMTRSTKLTQDIEKRLDELSLQMRKPGARKYLDLWGKIKDMLEIQVLQKAWTKFAKANMTTEQLEQQDLYLRRLEDLHTSIENQFKALISGEGNDKEIMRNMIPDIYETYIMLVDYFGFMAAAAQYSNEEETINTMIECRSSVEKNGMCAIAELHIISYDEAKNFSFACKLSPYFTDHHVKSIIDIIRKTIEEAIKHRKWQIEFDQLMEFIEGEYHKKLKNDV